MNTCVNDDSFGPAVQGCRDDFDFTQEFERIILSVVPTAVFLVLATALVCRLADKPRLVSGPSFQLIKVVSHIRFLHTCTECRWPSADKTR
jgi:ATP-binding cassette subfamily C (CFTR/MRP) protein 1